MSDNPVKATTLDDLPPELREHLSAIASSIQVDKITVSYSIEDRDMSGRKKSAFYCVTGSRGSGHDNTGSAFSMEETKIARWLLSKHVVASVYDDAIRRGIMSNDEARAEAKSILASYDTQIVKILMSKKDP